MVNYMYIIGCRCAVIPDRKQILVACGRKNEQSEWMPFTSEQCNFMCVPTRLFFLKAV